MARKNYRLGYTFEQYRQKIESGEWQLHSFENGFLVTQVVPLLEETVCVVHLAGGDKFDAWKQEAQERLIQFARECGCKAIEATCRLGMAHKLKPLGWRHFRTVMRLDI
jgi:hypothetical protein